MNQLAQVGTITPPSGTVPTAANPVSFIADLVQNGIYLLLIASFIIALIWIILAGLSFIFAGDDSKKVASSWSRIYWGLIGLVVVLGSFAIIKLVETFFGVSIISQGIQLPR